MHPKPSKRSQKSASLRRLVPLATAAGVLAIGLPSQAGLVAHYPLRADVLSTTGTNNGTFEGTAGANPVATFVEDSKFGHVLSFDGFDDRINLGNVLTLSGHSYSLSFWAQTPPNANTVPLIGKNNGDLGFDQYERVFEITGPQTWGPLYNGTPGNFAVNGSWLGGVSTDQHTLALNDGTWHMLTAVHDQALGDTDMRLYIDGVLQANHNNNGMANTAEVGVFYLGFSSYSGSGGGHYLNGRMAEVNFYDSAITPGAVSALYAFTPPTEFWTITASAGTGGSISPVGAVAVPKGADQPFIITPDKYFDVTGIALATGAVTVTSPDAQTYTMSGVAADGAITASFTEWTETSISGKVTLAGTTAVGGVLITASGGREPSTATTSAVDGTYSIRVKPGVTYTLTAATLPARTQVDTAPAAFTAVVTSNPDKNFTLTTKPVTLLVNYKFNGNCDDSSGNAKHGALQGAATYGTGYMASGSLDTTAAAGACSVPALGDGQYAAFTMSAWLKPTQDAAGYDAYRMALYQEPWAPQEVAVALTSNSTYRGMVAAIYGAAPEQAQTNKVSDWSLNTWHHLAIVYDSIAKTVKYYYDGTLTDTYNYTSTVAAIFVANSYIGSASGDVTNRSFRGEISDFRLYSDVLSDAEVAALAGVVTDPYTTWIDSVAFNTPTALTAGQKLPGADPDGDGMSNFQEFAFGLNPVLSSSCNPITVPLDKTTGKFSYTRLAASGLAYHVFTSTNLQTWVEEAYPANETVTATLAGVDTVDVTVAAIPVNGKLFVRVAAE